MRIEMGGRGSAFPAAAVGEACAAAPLVGAAGATVVAAGGVLHEVSRIERIARRLRTKKRGFCVFFAKFRFIGFSPTMSEHVFTEWTPKLRQQ
jgi:hypothetical protein